MTAERTLTDCEEVIENEEKRNTWSSTKMEDDFDIILKVVFVIGYWQTPVPFSGTPVPPLYYMLFQQEYV